MRSRLCFDSFQEQLDRTFPNDVPLYHLRVNQPVNHQPFIERRDGDCRRGRADGAELFPVYPLLDEVDKQATEVPEVLADKLSHPILAHRHCVELNKDWYQVRDMF